MLLVHGDADQSVPVELSRRYAAGGHAVYVELVGCGHLEHLDPASEAGRLAGNWLERLLAVEQSGSERRREALPAAAPQRRAAARRRR